MLWPQLQEVGKCQWPPEAGRGKEVFSPEPPEGVWLGGYLDFGLSACRTVRK